ncbi:MAG: nitrous oxide reductase family maturation protein NosD [Candidatus Marinimicrobia bacterium]|nr:nitrous oxide reductase family maturation protein NosD [Candidatus Neomarinimicrobiota bacterium]
MSVSRSIYLLLLLISAGEASIVHVGPDQAYVSIAKGILATSKGDTLLVLAGHYQERGLLVSHSLTLIGRDDPVIDAGGEGEILRILADSVSIQGFTFRGAGLSHLDENAAVRLETAHHGTVQNNRFVDNFFAIYVSQSSHTSILNNMIQGKAMTESRSGNAIHLWYCKNAVIDNNQVQGHRDGIYLEFVEECEIRNNISSRNLRYGLHFMFSNHNKYHHNQFLDNGAGVAVMYSRHVDMWLNTFADNWGGAAYGLLLKDIYDSSIVDNIFAQNTIGLYSEACNRVNIEGNRFEKNGWAVKVMANSMDNIFTRNNFVSNTFDVATNSRQNFNSFNNNYWSRYKGYDLDHDGVGDVPYRPVKLFSLIVEKNEPALMLMRSIFIEIIDNAESYLPILTPETLIDQKPLMRKN